MTAYIEQRLHQHIRTHNVATLAKPPSWFDGRAIRSNATGGNGSRSTSTYPPLLSTTYSRGRKGTTRQPESNWTSYTQRAGTVHFDGRQQPGSRGSAKPPISPSPYLRTGESLLVQQQWYDVNSARNQTRNGLEFDRGDVRRHQIRGGSAPSPVRNCCSRNWSLKATWCIIETAQDRLHDMGEDVSPPNVSQACTDPRQRKRRPEGEKTVISPKTVSVKHSSYQ